MMKRKLWFGGLALFGLLAMTLGLAFTVDTVEDPEEPGSMVTVIEIPKGPGCVCPMVFAPVVCDKDGQRKAYSNGCFAGCDNATNCAQVVWQGP
jgi:hypothetical protein